MEKRLTKNNREKLGQLIVGLYENASKEPKQHFEIHSRNGKGIIFDNDGRKTMAEAIKTFQTVPEWNEAYPPDAIHNRIIDSMFEGGELEDIVQRIIDGLNADCKAVRAYVAFSGFHLEPEVEIKIGKYVLRVLGQSGVESEIIGRLNQHMDAANFSEEEREKEHERYRKYLVRNGNLPTLVVEFHGSVDGAEKFIEPIAEYVALFMQFCVGALTNRFYDNPIIVDYRGRFSGDFSAYMPVMTVDFDRLSLPNLRGFPYDCVIGKDDIVKLHSMGILDLAGDFLNPPSRTPNAIRNLLVRAMCSFADGERAVSKLSRISAYVTATEVFFSQRERTVAWVTTGVAAANAEDESEFAEKLELAKAVYDERSRALHDGFEPKLTFSARELGLGSVLKMIKMQRQLTTRNKIREWLAPRVPDAPKKCDDGS